MDTVLGLRGDGFVVLAADTGVTRSIMRLHNTEDKIHQLDSSKILGCSGPQADRVNFCEYVQRNMAFYALKNSMELTTHSAAHFIRNELATALRKRPYQANILLAGYDVDDGATMYYMDYLASMHKVDKAAQGYGAYFTLGLMDRVWREGMSLEECVNLLKKCIAELSTRFMVNLPDFVVKVVDKDGVRIINLGDY